MIIIEKILISLFVGGIGLILVVAGIYLKIATYKFKKNGIKTIFKVKDVIVDSYYGEDESSTQKLFTTIFEFTYNGNRLEEKLNTKKEFEVNQEFEGIYLPTGKINKISVAGEGFQMSKIAEWILILFGLFLINLVLYVIFDLNPLAILIILITTLIFILGIIITSIIANKKLK